MKVLIVGGGAVGQVLGLHLQKAGVALGFYDLPQPAKRLKQALEQGGLSLFQTSYLHRRNPAAHRLVHYQVVTDVAESQAFAPVQVWFTTPSPVYYSAWFQEYLEQVPAERVVCFAPEGGRTEFFPAGGGERLVFAGFTMMAWQGDLEGSSGKPGGVNFYHPPLVGIPLTGTERACAPVKALLKDAGLRATVIKPDGPNSVAAVTGVMTAFMAGLELSGWSLKAFRRSPWLKQAARGAREAALGQLAPAGRLTQTLLGVLCSPLVFALLAWLLPLVFPFDLEKYLKFHYTKTRAQTLTLLEVFARDGEKNGILVESIRRLLQGLWEAPSR